MPFQLIDRGCCRTPRIINFCFYRCAEIRRLKVCKAERIIPKNSSSVSAYRTGFGYAQFNPVEVVYYMRPFQELLVSIIPDLNYPGKLYWEEPMSMGENNNNPYRGKVIILVNSRTISYAELYVMGLQTVNNSFTIGSQTLGADGNVSRGEFIGGFKTGFSGIGIFYPDFTETQRKGVRIDIEVKPSILGIKQGRDEVLEKAIKVAVE